MDYKIEILPRVLSEYESIIRYGAVDLGGPEAACSFSRKFAAIEQVIASAPIMKTSAHLTPAR